MSTVTDDQRTTLAFHEAGHAVMAMSFGFTVTLVSVRSDDVSEGRVCWNAPINDALDNIRKAVLIALAGMASDFLNWESISTPERDVNDAPKGVGKDLQKAAALLAKIDEGGSHRIYLAIAIKLLKQRERWRIVLSVAELLQQVDDLSSKEVLSDIKERCPKISDDEFRTIIEVVEKAKELERTF